jgi:SAM-dependent methyltransferase
VIGMTSFREYTDPRLAALYDTAHQYHGEVEFYAGLADRLGARSIIDIGCGTGSLTCALARRGHVMTGIDPAPAMLAVARSRPGATSVRWIDGDAAQLATDRPTSAAGNGAAADLVLMTAHVAQVIGDDGSWTSTLAAAHEALRPGGAIAFESRNPAPAPWTRWTPELSRRVIDHATVGQVDIWSRLIEVDGQWVHYALHYRFAATGEEIVAPISLRFRSEGDLRRSLTAAGFTVDTVMGDWDGRPLVAASPEMIFVAHRS